MPFIGIRPGSATPFWAWAAIVSAGLCFCSAAHAADKPGCQDPSWAPVRMPGFAIADCADLVWMSMDVELATGGKALEGSRHTVEYTLTDPAKDPTNAAAWQFFADQGKKSGATLVSDPAGWTAVLNRKTPDGEFYYMYRHSSGNDQSTGSFTLTTIKVGPMPQDVKAQDGPQDLSGGVKPCKDPPWLVSQFSYFKLDTCEIRDFDRIQLDLPTGDRTIEGRVLTNDYNLTDPAKEPVALLPARNYVNALTGIGARLVSDPDRATQPVLTRTTPQGEFWYIYRQTQGNDEAVGSYSLTTMQIAPMPQEVVVRDSTEPMDTTGTACKPPPWLVRQFPYFRLDRCDSRDFDSITLELPDGPKVLSGHVIVDDFVQSDESKVPVTFVLRQNYINALLPLGAQLVSDPDRINQAVLTRPTPQGEFWYIYQQSGGNEKTTSGYTLTTVQIGGPTPKACKLEIYGVNFDFDKAILRPESEPVLTQVLALFTGDPSYAAEIGGHTDNVGQRPYNLKLSGQRAAAVKDWLIAHGVAGSRMTSAGYADTRPLMPNTSDENRFRNRRVELQRKGCKS